MATLIELQVFYETSLNKEVPLAPSCQLGIEGSCMQWCTKKCAHGTMACFSPPCPQISAEDPSTGRGLAGA